MTAQEDMLGAIGEYLHEHLASHERAWEEALRLSRLLIRTSAQCVQALHRNDESRATALLEKARSLTDELRQKFMGDFPELYYSHLVQDALQEFVEARVVYGVFVLGRYPHPDELHVPAYTYVRGLAEAVGELRRRCLDSLRLHRLEEAEQLFGHMEAIYEVLVSMDYPDAVTGGLRRLTDIARALIERTRGELTLSTHLLATQKRLRNAASKSSSKG